MIDRSQLLKLYNDGFPHDSDDYARYFISSIPDNNIATVSDGKNIVSAGYLVPKRAVLYGKEIKIDYFSAISTQSLFRGRGIVFGVIRELLEKSFVGGAVFAALNPFNFEYYKRYGFVDASYCGKRVINGGKNFIIKRADYSDCDVLADIFLDYSAEFDFRQLCDTSYFKSLIDELSIDDGRIDLIYYKNKPVAYVVIDCGELTKYAAFRHRNIDDIAEFKGMSYDDFARKELVFTQMRIVNVRRLLEFDIFAEKNFQYVFNIRDEIIAENNGIFKVVCRNNQVSVEAIDDECREAKAIDIAELGRNFFNGIYPFRKSKVLFMDKF